MRLMDSHSQLATVSWTADRQLAATIHRRLQNLLSSRGFGWRNIEGVACFQGPGSFTGLRIGLSVAAALAWSLNVPAVVARGSNWRRLATTRLLKGKSDAPLLPYYGAPAHATPLKAAATAG